MSRRVYGEKIRDLEVDIFELLSDPDRRSGSRTLVF
jgi:hypothetical protein